MAVGSYTLTRRGGTSDAFLVRLYASNGTVVQAQGGGGGGTDVFRSVTVDETASPIAVGSTSSSAVSFGRKPAQLAVSGTKGIILGSMVPFVSII